MLRKDDGRQDLSRDAGGKGRHPRCRRAFHRRRDERVGAGRRAGLTFRTNVGDVVEAGPDHPLRFVDEDENGGLKPYLLVRGRLEALVARPVMYELVEHGEEIDIDGTDDVCRALGRRVFPIMPADDCMRLSA